MEIIFTDSSGLYFYSALLQANAAIIALIGLYTIFRIQVAYTTIESLKAFLLAEHSGIRDSALRFDSMDFKEKTEQIKKYTGDDSLSKAYRRWHNQIELISQHKRGIIFPTVLLGIALVSDSIFLFLTSSLHHSDINIEINWAIANLIYEIFLVIVISYRVIKLVTNKSSSD